ncbi:MAG: calcium-binding protein [Paracoccaceae bacterium]|nr:calcium-binding protein [Paracoccaceae bacterium]
MKKTTITALTALALAGGLAGAAAAQGAGGDRTLRGMDFETLDRTADGVLSVADLEAASDARFGELDADGDGAVTEVEFRARAVAEADARAAERFAALDADGDGTLSRDVFELRARGGSRMMARLIERFDADGDDGLSAEEFETARSAIRERQGPGPHRFR